MAKKKQLQQLLPWTNPQLETLLEGIISHGTETAKVDFKAEIETSTNEQKSELLKDITAIANTYDDDNNNDYGFLVYGVKPKNVVGIKTTEPDTDKLQNTVEQLLKTYISPMPQIYVMGFENKAKQKWGAIVIPPRNNKPYMFFKELTCMDKTKSRKKGEWFVRRGTTTDHGIPEDLSVITQRQMEASLEPLRESIKTLQIRVSKTEDQYNSALFKLVERALTTLPQEPKEESKPLSENIEASVSEVVGMDLTSRFKRKLKTPKNALADDLINEAKSLRDYLEGSDTTLPWTPQLSDPETNKELIAELEQKTIPLLTSMATIVLNDSENLYTDALLRAVKILAKTTEAPSGVQYNRIGEALRYYPLGLILYTIFICGVAAGRGQLLKQVLTVPLKHPRHSVVAQITDIFFYWYEARALFNDAYNQRLCEPIAQRLRQVINDHVGEMISDYSEPEYFFRGEFVLALTHIDQTMQIDADNERSTPIGGLYLYFHEAQEPITDLLRENPTWLPKLYNHPLEQILEIFDKNAHKVAGSGCIATGMHGLVTSVVYQDANKK